MQLEEKHKGKRLCTHIRGRGGEGGPFDLSIDSRAADGVDVAAAMIKLVVSRCNSSSSNHEQDALSDRPGCTTKLNFFSHIAILSKNMHGKRPSSRCNWSSVHDLDRLQRQQQQREENKRRGGEKRERENNAGDIFQ